MKKKIRVEIEIQTCGKYCGMNCPFLGNGYCCLFGKFLDSEFKERKNYARWRYIRCPECLEVER